MSLAGCRGMLGVSNDLRLAARGLRRSPGFASAAILTLALGIGANATIYSLADAVLFRPLDVPGAERIVHIFERREQPGNFPLPYVDYFSYREHARSFDALAAHYPTAPLQVNAGAAESINGAVVTHTYFDVLGIRPAIGRFFAPEEDRVKDRDAVAVISDSFWQRRFGRDPSAIGRGILINGRPFTVVGVAPRGFSGVQPRSIETEIWIPAAMFGVGYRYCDAFARGCTIAQLLGRLKPGVAVEAAERELDLLLTRLETAAPRTVPSLGVAVVPARGLGVSAQSSEARQMQLFVGVVSLVLVLACANVAGLLLARATGRRRDVALRLALGAGRRRIIQQFLAESALLAVLGGAAGLLISIWGNDFLASLYARDLAGRPVAFDLTLRGAVVAATFAVTIVTALLTGLAPAVQASRADLIGVLKDEGASGGARRAYLRTLLVSAQVAVSVVLLVGASLLIQSMRHAYRGPGFDPDPLIMLRLRPSLLEYPRERAHAFQRDALRAIEALPGVTSASTSVYLSMFSAGQRVGVASESAGDTIDAIANAVGPRYFETVGLRLLEGREFTPGDRVGAPPVVIVNDVLARRLWPTGASSARALVVDGRPHTVVGVVPDAQYYPAGDPPRPQVFFSYWQPSSDDAFLNDSRTFVRVAGNPAAMMGAIRRAVAQIDPTVPIAEDYPVRDRVAYAFQPLRLARGLLTAFAALAMLLSAVGLYGVLAFSVAQRRREIGVRIALGASRGDIATLVLREGLMVTAAGLAVGLLAAWAAAQTLDTLLFGVDARAVGAYLAPPALIVAVALVASLVPAHRALSVPPLAATRSE